MFYAYAYPEPAKFADWPVRPDGARYDEQLGEFVLPYSTVQEAVNPDDPLLAFLQSTYEAAAELGHWDRDTLECKQAEPDPHSARRDPRRPTFASIWGARQ